MCWLRSPTLGTQHWQQGMGSPVPVHVAATAGGWLTCQHLLQSLFTRYFAHIVSFKHFRQKERLREHWYLEWPGACERHWVKWPTERIFLIIHLNHSPGSCLFTRTPKAPQPWPQSDPLGGKTAAASSSQMQTWSALCSSYSNTTRPRSLTYQAHVSAVWDTAWPWLHSPAGTCGGLTSASCHPAATQLLPHSYSSTGQVEKIRWKCLCDKEITSGQNKTQLEEINVI